MRILRLFLVSFSLLFLSGCWIYTLNPLYQDQDVYAFDASLTGSWINPVGDCLLTLSPDNNLYPSYYRVLYSAPDPQKGECLVDRGQKAEFEGRIVKLGQHSFLDLEPAPQDMCLQCWALHSLYLVSIDKDELSVIPIDYKWFQNGLQQKKLKVPLMEGSKGFADNAPLIIMLSTRDLRQFVAKYADNKDAFKANERYVYKRK